MNEFAIVCLKGIILQILRSFDVVLVVICPVEFHLLAFVRDGIDIFLVTAQRDEVSRLVIALKETCQMRKNLLFQRIGIDCVFQLCFPAVLSAR